MRVGRILGLSLLMVSASALADAPPAPPPQPDEQYHWQLGPKPLDLGHEVSLALPEHYAFLGMPEADRFMRKNGSFSNAGLVGIVVAEDPNEQWGIIISYDESGHVADNEKIDQAALLKAIREGTEESNKERVEHGFTELHVGDWSESPHYDATVHRLVWGLPATSARGTTINYNTRVLGRRGVVSLNLLSDPARFPVEKAHAATLLAATTFKQGARYQDFDKKNDKVAEYGLMGLILGGAGIGAAKLVKVGLIAGLWKYLIAFLLAAKKAIVLLFVGIGAGIKRIFGGKKVAATTPAVGGTPPAADAPAPAAEKLPPTGTDGAPPGA